MKGLEPIAAILPGLMQHLGLADDAAGWRPVTEWPAVAGTRIAKHTHEGLATHSHP